jgi:hypothetical protein
MAPISSALFLFGVLNSLTCASQSLWKPVSDTSAIKKEIRVLPRNFYSQHLTYFCKKELELQKIKPGGIFFRVGSKEYVDWLERKPNSGFHNN